MSDSFDNGPDVKDCADSLSQTSDSFTPSHRSSCSEPKEKSTTNSLPSARSSTGSLKLTDEDVKKFGGVVVLADDVEDDDLDSLASLSDCEKLALDEKLDRFKVEEVDDDDGVCLSVAVRPGLGTAGRRIPVRANFFEIKFAESCVAVHQYHAEIHHSSSRTLDRDEKRQVFWKIVESNRNQFQNLYGIAYDGAHQVFTTEKICSGTALKVDADVKLLREAAAVTRCGLSLQYGGQVPLMELLASGSEYCAIQILDIIVRQGLTSPLCRKSSQFYPWRNSCYRLPDCGLPTLDLGGGKEMWTGFFTSAHIGDGWRPLLNVDVAHTAFYKPNMNMMEFMCELLNEHSGAGGRSNRGLHPNRFNGRSSLTNAEMRILHEGVKGLRVRVSYNEGNVRVYRVNGVRGPANMLSFPTRDANGVETTMTVAEYFNSRYGALKFPAMPCLHVGSMSRNILLPLEVCCLDSPQKYVKKLSDRQAASIIRASAVDAQQRERNIKDLCVMAGFSTDPYLDAFRMKIDTKMVETVGRVLPPPRLSYGQSEATMVTPHDGIWSGENQRFYAPAECRSYAILAMVDQREQPALQSFCDMLHKMATNMGMKFPKWPDVVRYGDWSSVELMFEQTANEYNRLGACCDLVIVVLPAKNPDAYMSVKEMSDMKYGVMSQCILFKSISRPSPATCENILLKINMKLGGVNCCLIADQVTEKYLVNQPTLVLGIDVTHPTQPEERMGMPSVAAVVGNIDTLPQSYGANVKVQRRCRESVVYVAEAVRERIMAFWKSVGQMPERIIVYRDGVSSGQFAEVLREEMNGIRAACQLSSPGSKPQITYIVVQKRHHARVFCKNSSDTVGKSKNVPPGTIVDQGIVSPQNFDFYLCSHYGIQGTSRPARYQVLWDDNGFTADELQAFTYHLCYTYGRCSRSVSIPAPVYYADLVATRARCHLKRKIMLRNERGRGGNNQHTKMSGANAIALGSEKNAGVDNYDSAMRSYVAVAESFKERMYFI